MEIGKKLRGIFTNLPSGWGVEESQFPQLEQVRQPTQNSPISESEDCGDSKDADIKVIIRRHNRKIVKS